MQKIKKIIVILAFGLGLIFGSGGQVEPMRMNQPPTQIERQLRGGEIHPGNAGTRKNKHSNNMQIIRPPHKKYLLHKCNNARYAKYFNGYSKAKRFGFRSVVGYLSGQNIAHIAYDLGKGQLVYWGKRRVGYALVSYLGWVAAPLMPIITNSNKVIKIANFTHRVTSEIFEISENGACAWMFPIDLLVFGQPVPVGSEGRFNIISDYKRRHRCV